MHNRFLTNPYILYTIVWIFVLCVYKLQWSTFYSPLSHHLIYFIVCSSLISFLVGTIMHIKKIFVYRPLFSFSIRKIRLLLILLYALLFVEFIFARNIPIMGYIGLGPKMEYTEFGLPFIHVIVISGFSVICLYSYHCALSSNSIHARKTLKRYIFLSILPYILIFNRGAMIACIIGLGSLYIMSNISPVKAICKIILSGMVVLFTFGVLGNIRTDINNVENVILEIGGASDDFKNSPIPKEFFWGYIYVASPIGNCDYAIKQTPSVIPKITDVRDFMIFELLPELLSKRIANILQIERQYNPLVIDSLNVSTIYARPYMYLGWWGIVFMFIYIMTFITLVLSVIPKGSPYYVTSIVIIDIIIVQSIFDNMLTFMGVIPMIILVTILSFKFFIRRLRRIKDINCYI